MNRAVLKKGLEAGSSQQDPIDLTCDETVAPSPKRMPGMKRAASTAHVPQSSSTPRRKRKAPEDGSSPPTEKRLRAHRSHPPLAFHNVHDRALSQRFYVLERTPSGTDECPEEIFKMTGSTGNIYTVHIKQQPTCDCPHALKGNQCKHVIYILSRVLQAPYELVYQLALLSTELRSIFAKAPSRSPARESESGKRKDIEGECPICFCAFDTKSPESIVWCKAACGQNIHQDCFKMWAKTKTGDVTCPFCRSKWETDSGLVPKVATDGGMSSEGYINVADQLGINPHRDSSSYYSGWSQYGYGRRSRAPWYERIDDYTLDRYYGYDDEEDDDEEEYEEE
ncbi:Mitogen-activated protein kinase kinase kinase 1 [Metarhizium brunneum]|uniref:Mitogen-activated protein kinase kinase kinase 1 n=1 Tax=Metarhizium brunneum TaxID=500148 RepID=A0A7D5UQT8_9HYPO